MGYAALVHLFFIICHPYIPLHLEEIRNDLLPIFGCAECTIKTGKKEICICNYRFLLHNWPSLLIPPFPCSRFFCLLCSTRGWPIKLRPHRYDATLASHKPHFYNKHARGRSRRGTLSKMASFIVDLCRAQRFSLETWDWRRTIHCGSLHPQ